MRLSVVVYRWWLVFMLALVAGEARAVSVSDVYPADLTVSVPINVNVFVIFDKVMDAGSITTTTFRLLDGGSPVAGSVTYDAASRTAKFDPTSNLTVSHAYAVEVVGGTSGVQDVDGADMAADFDSTLTTGASSDTTAPTVFFTIPGDGSTAVSTSARVHVVFQEKLDPTTITSANAQITLASVPITAVALIRSNGLSIRPLGQFTASTVYGVKLIGTSGVKDLSGNALASDYTGTFTTDAIYAFGTTLFDGVTVGGDISVK